ncbi:MAG: hypothetical protein MI924_18490 [Chloroflexales bacterium]|nr:hypothetical protein [Chloroflexales bacterium]
MERRKPGTAGALKSRKHHLDEGCFSQINTDDKAYIVGFIFGDGTLID